MGAHQHQEAPGGSGGLPSFKAQRGSAAGGGSTSSAAAAAAAAAAPANMTAGEFGDMRGILEQIANSDPALRKRLDHAKASQGSDEAMRSIIAAVTKQVRRRIGCLPLSPGNPIENARERQRTPEAENARDRQRTPENVLH